MKFSPKLKKLLSTVFVILLVGFGLYWLITDDTTHIEDTNGDDNYALQQITDQNIVKLDMGAIGGPNIKTSFVSDTETYYANKFTGVAEIYGENLITNRLTVTVNHAQVEKGNFKMVLLVGNEIVHEFSLNEFTQTYTIEDVSGYVSLRIAGESADFSFDYYII